MSEQRPKTQAEIDLEIAAFDALCDQAHAALDDLATHVEQYVTTVAEQHHVEHEQVEIRIVDKQTRLEPVINPLAWNQGEE